MKPFNLEEYLDNPSRKIVTREGKPARIICTDAKFEKYQVLALITKKGRQEFLATLDTSGKFRSGYDSPRLHPYVPKFNYLGVTIENIHEIIADFYRYTDLFDNIIDCIEWLIKEGYFNKEYLV